MIVDKKKFFGGIAMLLVFATILFAMFLPMFGGQNSLEYLDSLYNSISKSSAYYIPSVMKEVVEFDGNSVNFTVDLDNETQIQQTAELFKKSGVDVTVTGNSLNVVGDLGKILTNCLVDTDSLYKNHDKVITSKYGYEAKLVIYRWWGAFGKMDEDLKRQKKFPESKIVSLVLKKAIEPSYNYYGIEPQNVRSKALPVIVSLVFYVAYTILYGFAIMFMLEGCGIKSEH